MKTYKFLCIILLISFQSLIAQNDYSKLVVYDNLYEIDGLEYSDGITFYIEKNSGELVAVQDGFVKWKVDVVSKCCKKKRRSNIESVFIKSDKLKVTFGKNKVAFVKIENGEIECLVNEKRKE